MWKLDYKESWALKNWYFLTVVLEKTLESPLDCKEIKPVNPKGNQPWIFIGRTEAETPILWPPDVKNWLIEYPDAGKDWRREVKGMTEDEMVGRHHWHNGQEFEQTLGAGEGQGSLACWSPWGSQRVRHDWATQQQLHRLTSSSCPTSFYPWTLGRRYFFALARDCWCEFSLLTPLAIPSIFNKTETYHPFCKFCQIRRDYVELRHRG